jgi:histidinol-phosphatase
VTATDQRSIIRECLTHALRILEDTGSWIVERSSRELEIRTKQDRSFVTDVDLEVERRIRDSIHRLWPEHSIVGEEHGSTAGSGEYRWTVDPIDGTMSLRHGIPLYGTILALHHGDEPLIGIIQLPALRRCFWAGRGLGAFRNGKPIRIRDVPADLIGSEVIALGDRLQFVRAGMGATFESVMREHPWSRTYTDCFGHVLAADGSVGAMIDPDLKIWDVAATGILLTEAGGSFVRLKSDSPDRWNVVFGKPTVVEWLLDRFELERGG